IWKPLMDTLKMSFLGSLIGALLALPVAVLSSSNITRNKVVVSFFKFLLSLIRTLPTLVSALIATFIFGLGPTAGTVAILLFTLPMWVNYFMRRLKMWIWDHLKLWNLLA